MKHFAPLTEIATPHRAARQDWDDRLGRLWKDGHYWMWAFFLMLAYNVWAGIQDKRLAAKRQANPIEIFYVAMSPEGVGTVLGKAPLPAPATKEFKEARVRRFVVATRGKSLDPVMVRKAWEEEARNWVTPRGEILLAELSNERKPLTHNLKLSIGVEITRLVLKSDQSYDVWWTETQRDHNNNKETVTYWSANYTVVVEKPKTEKQLRANETGVFIDYFSPATRY